MHCGPPASAMPGAPNVVPTPKEVNGPFRIWRQLSSGGFARAMGAEDVSSSRLLCLKVFRKTQLKHNGTEEGLLNEIQVYKRLESSKERCPGAIFLMALQRSFQTVNYICFAMDLMACDLWHYMNNESDHCRENARRWSAQVALGINALHAIGIIHCDIKPANILIDIQENVKIADFGLSFLKKQPKRLHKFRGYSSDLTGIINFMAPEILAPRAGATLYWWAFGCVLYELLSLPQHKELFGSADDTMAYVVCHTKKYGNFYPAFLQLGEIETDLVVGLLDPDPLVRYRFKDIIKHEYFSNDDGTTEFSGACSRAVQREEQSNMLPSLRDEETEKAKIWRPLPPGHPEHIANMDWKKPRP
ncbi:kinase-like domain-containing protein [Suillus occidentalis]|nr:kinase-like domain-containing protein [Suillus occidentalis]